MLFTKNFEEVDKNAVSECLFPKEALFNDQTKRTNLLNKLKFAAFMGNVGKTTCRIFFKDNLNIKVVETTIGSTYEDFIELKSGACIPTNRIIDVIL